MKSIFQIILLLCSTTTLLFSQSIEGLKEATPFAYSGGIVAQTGMYQASGIESRAPSNMWSLSGNMNFTLYDQVNLPFAFTFGRYGAASSYPTFGQIGMSPSYKWVTLHLGYRNMNFSPYTLAGHSFLGVGVELNPGKFRVAAMYGRLRDAAEVDTTRAFVPPAFKRTGYGVKLGIGEANKFVDFIFFRAKDDQNSLETEQSIVTPAENLVLGISTQFPLFKVLSFQGDIAGSIFTRNQNSKEVLLESLDENFDQFKVDQFFTPKASTRANLASRASLNYQHPKNFRLKIEYERIDPQYETMGAYFFANDLERITVAPTFHLFNKKVSVNGSYGMQRNNLLNDRLETTNRSISSANIDVHLNAKFGVNLNFSNYSIYQEAGRLDLNDTIAFNLATTTIGLVPRLNIQGEKTMLSFMLNGNYQKANQDNDLFFGKNQNFESQLVALTQTLVFLQTQFVLNTGLNYHQFSVANTETELIGGTIGCSLPLFQQKLTFNFSNALNIRRINGASDGNTLNSYGAISYRPNAVHSFTLNMGWLQNFGAAFSNFSEFRGGLVYTFLIPAKGKRMD